LLIDRRFLIILIHREVEWGTLSSILGYFVNPPPIFLEVIAIDRYTERDH